MEKGSALQGLRIAVTRPERTAGELGDRFMALGAVPVLAPLIRTVIHSGEQLRRAARQVGQYDWFVFTSATAVESLAAALRCVREESPQADPAAPAHSALLSAPSGSRVAAVGAATATAIRDILGWSVHAMPSTYAGAAVAGAMLELGSLHGAQVLWPRARRAGAALPRALRAAGALLDDPEAYSTEPRPESARELIALLHRQELDVLTFTSPSAVHSLADAGASPGRAVVAVIGPSTAAAARVCGWPVHVQPPTPVIPALVDAVLEHFRHRPPDMGQPRVTPEER